MAIKQSRMKELLTSFVNGNLDHTRSRHFQLINFDNEKEQYLYITGKEGETVAIRYADGIITYPSVFISNNKKVQFDIKKLTGRFQ